MTVKYDAYYRDGPHALGPPTKRLVAFLSKTLQTGANILDIGCGQGRDAVWLAQAGHRVTGIDLSSVGIAQLAQLSATQSLAIVAEVADPESYQAHDSFECVLFDRTLHMLDEQSRHAGFAKLLDAVKPSGCVVVLDEAPNLEGLAATIPSDWAKIWGGKSDFAYRRPAET